MAKFIDSVKKRIKAMFPEKVQRKTIESDYVLETENLGISFGGLKAVQNVNLKISKNQIYGLVGPNGAGKTTVFNLLTGVYQPTEGTFYLNGEELRGLPQEETNHKGIARTFQNIRLFNKMSVLDNVRVGLHNHTDCNFAQSFLRLPAHFKAERKSTEKALELLSIFDMENDAYTMAGNLPYGAQRRLEIIRALATSPKLLLLDEPAAGMNPSETAALMESIRKIRDTFHIAILLIEHDMNLVMNVCEGIAVLNFGKIIAKGSPEQIKSNEAVIEAYLGHHEEDDE